MIRDGPGRHRYNVDTYVLSFSSSSPSFLSLSVWFAFGKAEKGELIEEAAVSEAASWLQLETGVPAEVTGLEDVPSLAGGGCQPLQV
jgi:hypothetical protein